MESNFKTISLPRVAAVCPLPQFLYVEVDNFRLLKVRSKVISLIQYRINITPHINTSAYNTFLKINLVDTIPLF